MDLEKLNSALDKLREAVGLPDDLPVEGCKEPEYAGGRYKILQALVADNIVSKEDVEIWVRTYYG